MLFPIILSFHRSTVGLYNIFTIHVHRHSFSSNREKDNAHMVIFGMWHLAPCTCAFSCSFSCAFSLTLTLTLLPLLSSLVSRLSSLASLPHSHGTNDLQRLATTFDNTYHMTNAHTRARAEKNEVPMLCLHRGLPRWLSRWRLWSNMLRHRLWSITSRLLSGRNSLSVGDFGCFKEVLVARSLVSVLPVTVRRQIPWFMLFGVR